MTPSSDLGVSLRGWTRVGYADMRLTTRGSSTPAVLAPAIPIIVRNPLAGVLPDASNMVRGKAIVDTGAIRSSIPLWAALHLGIVKDGDAKQSAFGVGGRLDGYHAEVSIEAWIGDSWIDVGVVTVLVPDTERSRSKSAGQPFLLGRNGFFDKFNVCFDELNKAMQFRRVGI